MILYPASFPCPSRIEGHSQSMAAGLVRTPMEAGNARQRRMHRVLPTAVSLVFMIDQEAYAAWLVWVNTWAFDGFVTMKLPGLEASRLGQATAPIAVRFISDLEAELVPAHRLWYWRVRVTAEYQPGEAALEPVTRGAWIIARYPSTPGAEAIIAGRPGSPSPIGIDPGTVLAPAATL